MGEDEKTGGSLVFALPPAGGSAGENQSALCYREADFLRAHRSAELRNQLCGKHVGEDRRSQPCCVGVNQIEQRLIRQKFGAELHKGVDGILNFPDLSLRSSSVGRRIHDNSVVVIAAPDFPLHKFDAVVNDPADGGIGKIGGTGIFLGPGYHSLGGIHVSDMGACLGGRQGCASGVGKQVENFYRSSGLSYLLSKPVPVRGLLRKQAGMLEAEGLQVEGQFSVADGPLLGQIEEFPLASTTVASVIMAVHPLPSLVPLRRIPDNLGIRPDKQILAPALQLFTFGAVYYFIIFPAVSYPHMYCSP